MSGASTIRNAAGSAAGSAAKGSFSQTGFLVASVGFAFLVFITARGDLAKWLGAFGLAGGSASGAGGSSAASGAGGSALPALPALGAALPGLPALPAGL